MKQPTRLDVDMLPEILLSLSEAAIYLNLPPLRMMQLVATGQVPKPGYIRNGRRMWSMRQLDRLVPRATDYVAAT